MFDEAATTTELRGEVSFRRGRADVGFRMRGKSTDLSMVGG